MSVNLLVDSNEGSHRDGLSASLSSSLDMAAELCSDIRYHLTFLAPLSFLRTPSVFSTSFFWIQRHSVTRYQLIFINYVHSSSPFSLLLSELARDLLVHRKIGVSRFPFGGRRNTSMKKETDRVPSSRRHETHLGPGRASQLPSNRSSNCTTSKDLDSTLTVPTYQHLSSDLIMFE